MIDIKLQIRKAIRNQKRRMDPEQERRLQLRKQASDIFEKASDTIYKRLFPRAIDKNFKATEQDCLDFSEVLTLLNSKQQTKKKEPSLIDCVKNYCNLRKKAITKDDDLDIDFIPLEDIARLREVLKQILSAIKERCEQANINVTTKDDDLQGRLSWMIHLYNIIRNICNALTTISRSLRKLKKTIECRSKEEQKEITTHTFDRLSRESRNIVFKTISENLVTFSKSFTTQLVNESLSESIVLLGKNSLTRAFLSSPRDNIVSPKIARIHTNQEFYDFAFEYGRWHAWTEIKDKPEICLTSPPCAPRGLDLLDRREAFRDLVDSPMVTIEKKELLKHDLEQFVAAETGKKIEDLTLKQTTTLEKRKISISMCICLSMACCKKLTGFIPCMFDGLSSLLKYYKFFFTEFFGKYTSDYIVRTTIMHLKTIFDPKDNNFKEIEINSKLASLLKNKLPGLRRFFPSMPGELDFRRFIQHIHDQAKKCFDNNFVASHYGISFA